MSSRYDSALTIFSPDGHIFQVEYAQEAVKKGSTVVGVRGDEILVIAVEKRAVAQLQDARTVRKICSLDDHICMSFAGLTADARILINWARVECQSYRLRLEDPVTVEYITSHLASICQRYTQSNGARPFGISTLVAGFDEDGTPHLFQTEPAGTYQEWKANSIGKNAKTVREYLEKNYNADSMKDKELVIKLAVKALLEVVQSGSQSIEMAVLEKGKRLKFLTGDEIGSYVKAIEEEKEEEAKKKKQKKEASS